MAWIKSNQNIKDNPKTIDLANTMGWSINETIGILHRVWWWCLEYAETGDLRKHPAARIARACDVRSKAADQFLDALVGAGFVDKEPYLRIHDWWEHVGPYLSIKYRSKGKTSEKIAEIRDLYMPSGNTCETQVKPEVDEIREDKTEKIDIRGPLAEVWNSTELPKIINWSASRIDKLQQRLKEPLFVDQWRKAVDKLSSSDFCLGKGPPAKNGGTPWRASIDWFLENDTNYVKALEGKYINEVCDKYTRRV